MPCERDWRNSDRDQNCSAQVGECAPMAIVAGTNHIVKDWIGRTWTLHHVKAKASYHSLFVLSIQAVT